MAIPFIDLAAQQARLRSNLDAAVSRVLDEGQYIMGPDVARLEKQLAEFCGAKHALSCANGTDALQLALLALGVKAGDAVFVPSFTFAATAEVVPFVNATPVFVDCLPDTFNMDPESLKRAIVHAKTEGLTPKCVIPVDLFGLPADYDAILAIARENDLKVIGDSAQAGAATTRDGSPVRCATSPPPRFSLQSRSAAMATAVPSSPMTTNLPRCSIPIGSTARVRTNIITSVSA